MTGKRPIAAIELPGVAPGAPPTSAPEAAWFEPTELVIDPKYQRDLSDAGKRLIRKIVERWDWRKFKAPTAAWSDDGLEVIDGQHTAIAAATHPAIERIPVLVVEAADQRDRAGAFIGVNRDRLAVSAPQMHAAAVVAGDHDAMTIDKACADAGITLLTMSPSKGVYKPRQSISTAAIGALIRKRGIDEATEILAALAKTDLAPISAAAIKAADDVIHNPEFAGSVEVGDLARIISALGAEGEKEAKAFAATHCVPLWRGLAAIWFKNRRKRTQADQPKEIVGETTVSLPVNPPKIAGRPARNGWVPGRHARRCRTCDESFVGARAATTCEPCAYGEEKAA